MSTNRTGNTAKDICVKPVLNILCLEMDCCQNPHYTGQLKLKLITTELGRHYLPVIFIITAQQVVSAVSDNIRMTNNKNSAHT